jgi:hypothetical protein
MAATLIIRFSCITALITLLSLSTSAQPVIINPSFEVDPTPAPPGYGIITGWMPGGGLVDGYGINEVNGAFADNGLIPDGTRVAFIQDNGALSQRVSGFTVGAPYWLAYRENARGFCCGERFATLLVTVDGRTVIANHVVPIVGDTNPYRIVTSAMFTASATDLTVSFTKSGMGDSTALIDDVRIFNTNALQLAMTLQNGNVPAIHIQGLPGWNVSLEYSASLAQEAWQGLTNLVLTTGSALVVDRSGVDVGPRFYRAHRP